MTKWMQYTYVNGESRYTPRLRTDEELVGLFAQCHFLRDAGETIAFSQEVDADYKTVMYQMIRIGKDGKVLYHEYHKMNDRRSAR